MEGQGVLDYSQDDTLPRLRKSLVAAKPVKGPEAIDLATYHAFPENTWGIHHNLIEL
jgi:hypothetical protein